MNFKLYYPNFKSKAVTFSYDDGIIQDIKTIEILRKHNMKGTFNLNYGQSNEPKFRIDKGGKEIDCSHLDLEKNISVYDGMEIANHTLNHPHLQDLSYNVQEEEYSLGREKLEKLFQRKVYGAAYPYGTYNRDTFKVQKKLNVEYDRTTRSTYDFSLPYNWLLWNPTIHHRDKRIYKILEEFQKADKELALLYIWGHSYEFAIDHNFELLDDICKILEMNDEIACMTNHEIYTYVNAANSLYYSRMTKEFINISDVDIYLVCDNKKIIVPKKGRFFYENEE